MSHLPAPPPLRPLPLSDLLADAAEASWLWEGYLAAGAVTLLTSRWKAGKTTLLSVLLARLGEGGELAGRVVRPGKALVVTEEDASLWGLRARALGMGDQVRWLCRPFPGKPTPGQWRQLFATVRELRGEAGVSLFVIDPLAMFLPVADENNAGPLVQALAPLRDLTAEGLAVLLLHHPRKARSVAGSAARGSGALAGFADVLIEMTHGEPGAPEDRRRQLHAWSRFPATPRRLTLELNAEGTDYRAVCEARGEPMPEGLQMLLEGAPDKVTRRQIQEGWLPDFLPRPDGSTLTRWLAQAVARGEVCREGTGHRYDPFRYWLPGREEVWRQDPAYQVREMLEEEARRAREGLPEDLRRLL